jgi:hypothetical protein
MISLRETSVIERKQNEGYLERCMDLRMKYEHGKKLMPRTPCSSGMQMSNFVQNVIGWFMVFNATFNNISVISWWTVFLAEETGIPRRKP